MEAVCELLQRHGYEMGRNQIAELLRKEGQGIGNDELKGVIDSLLTSGSIDYRREGQKYLYGFRAPFFAHDVKAWNPDE